MKKMTCKDLGGPCNEVFEAETFEEMAELSKKHAMLMFMDGDSDHIEAMKIMSSNYADQESMNAWMKERKDYFDSL